jgi:hypothetical protein
MIDERAHALCGQHVHDLDAGLDALLGIGIERNLQAIVDRSRAPTRGQSGRDWADHP